MEKKDIVIWRTGGQCLRNLINNSKQMEIIKLMKKKIVFKIIKKWDF